MLRVNNILYPTDLSPGAAQGFSYARELAAFLGARVHALNVVVGDGQAAALEPVSEDDLRRHLLEGENGRTNELLAYAIRTGTTSAAGILDYAREQEIDLMVVGLKGTRRASPTIRGGLAYDLIRRSPCPVLTARGRLPSRGVERILVPIDFSELSRQAVAIAKEVAHLFGARLDVLHVLSSRWEQTAFTFSGSNRPRPELARQWEAAVHAFASAVPGPDVDTSPLVRVGGAAPTITNVTLEMRSDLLVMATHGGTGLRGTVMGSVAESAISCSPCPTLSVKSFGRSPLVGALDAAPEFELPPLEPSEPARKPRRLGVSSIATG